MKNSGGQMYARRISHEVKGVLSGSSSTEITQEMNALITALAVPYKDFILYHDDDSESATTLKNSGSISGVTVDGPHFIETRGPQYATLRDFTFTVTAEYPLAGTNNFLLSFSESVTNDGGGPKFVVLEAVVGLPQKQQVREYTTYTAVQEGSAEGYKTWPTVPPPIWPGDLLHAPMIRRMSPDKYGKGYQRFGLSWRYVFASPVPLTGLPHLWT
jgi:hypothetical protein